MKRALRRKGIVDVLIAERLIQTDRGGLQFGDASEAPRFCVFRTIWF